jgi:hypothetical protein
VTLAFKGTALSDVCEAVQKETGIHLVAGNSVADEKVTLFCEKLPLREVMRQLSRPFGYTWLRSGTADEYRYELAQDLRSQLLEEELRNRDRNAALLALEKEIERYRPYLDLSPDEALARSKSASPEEKKLLERLATDGWGPVQIYFRLSHSDLAALRAGQAITFSQEPKPGERPLPADVAHGLLQSWRDWRVVRGDDGLSLRHAEKAPDGLALTAVPEVRARVELSGINQAGPGLFSFEGASCVFSVGNQPRRINMGWSAGPLASGRGAAVVPPQNAVANARRARDPELQSRVTVVPGAGTDAVGGRGAAERPTLDATPAQARREDEAPDPVTVSGLAPDASKVTSAGVLEALHHATSMPIVGDYYTRMLPLPAVSVREMPLFDALNQLCDGMRMHWLKEPQRGWLQFRSATYFSDRLEEVPNRLLTRWAASRQKHGTLMLDDLVEIAQLSDAQLNAPEMAEGARLIFGLAEWDLARSGNLRPHFRYLARFTPAQRQEMMSGTGLTFTRMSLAQQQEFIALAVAPDAPPFQSLEELAGATLRVDYTVPGWFTCRVPDPAWRQWVVQVAAGPEGRRAVRPPVREQTQKAALQTARRLDPTAEEAQIVPTSLNCAIIYIPGTTNARAIHRIGVDYDLYTRTW